ncbi:hypothetical protein [Bifidobacterium aquikefiricola]|uniref:Integrase n=1 Tax=Bifidobacterium aquikefiricola TaxID=3059038 RepID=A0AB39U7D0_9BIFI
MASASFWLLKTPANRMRTRWYQISRFSRRVGKAPANATTDDAIRVMRNRNLRNAVKSFYEYAVERGYAQTNPTTCIPKIAMSPFTGIICQKTWSHSVSTRIDRTRERWSGSSNNSANQSSDPHCEHSRSRPTAGLARSSLPGTGDPAPILTLDDTIALR